MDSQKLSREIWENYSSTDWKSDLFSLKRSYICSLFSQIAYEHVPQYELNQTSRIKIIPSEDYWYKISNKISFNVADILGEMDFGENFVIESENLIVVSVKVRNTLFVAIRGTRSLNDILVDIKLLKIPFHYDAKVKLHRGFYKAVLKEYDNIVENISKFNRSDIFITGHSLGGAMAAILFNLLKHDSNFNTIEQEQNLIVKSCYTFGMPRFGNSVASNKLISPFQIYNTNDIVPIVPPKWFGYQNSPNEYKLLPNSLLKTPNLGKMTVCRFIRLLDRQDLSEHSINLYSNRLRNLIV